MALVENGISKGLRISAILLRRWAPQLNYKYSTQADSKINVKEEFSKTIKNDVNPNLRLRYPEFLPNPTIKWRNSVREKLERQDMINRRKNIDLPEFYVGSIMAVTTADRHATGKSKRFVGICIEKDGVGLRAWFALRNVIEHQGVEFRYELYSPLIQKIEVLRLEKRPDSNLLYLRDASHEYSTFPFDMEPEYRQPGAPIPVNLIKVIINPRPWLARYERMNLKGAILPVLSEKMQRQAVDRAKPWEKYDLVDYYRKTIPEEEQRQIFNEIQDQITELEGRTKTFKRRKTFSKPGAAKTE